MEQNSDTDKKASARQKDAREFNFTKIEKQAAAIVDQLCPVFTDRTKAYIGPDTFKALTLRLAEMLEPLGAKPSAPDNAQVRAMSDYVGLVLNQLEHEYGVVELANFGPLTCEEIASRLPNLLAQRDELLAAAKAIEPWIARIPILASPRLTHDLSCDRDALREAIANAERSAQ